MLNKEQNAAASDLDGTSIIIAGAGTGKTQTLIHKLVNLVQKGVNPSRICLLTFTNEAANTMKERAVALGSCNMTGLTACTYHSFCDRLMRKYNHLIGQPNDYTILEPSMVNDIVSIKLNEYKKDMKARGITRLPTAKTVAGIFSAAINQDVPLKELVTSDSRIIKLCNGPQDMEYMYQMLVLVRENVHEYKVQKNLKDFDDMLLGAYKLLDDQVVRNMVNNMYQYILIDEYQDTNHLQAQIVHQLRDTNDNLVVVGDDFQSIYKFRGAEVKNFTDFPSEFANVHEHKLIQNYRSTQEILDLSNAVMKKHADFGFQKDLVTGRNKHGDKPTIIQLSDQRKEGDVVYRLIQKYRKDDPSSTIAVLYRGSNSSIYIENILHKNGIPYEKHGGVAFFDKEHVQTVLSYLRVIANPFHELAWYRILMQYSHIGNKRASDMAAMSKDIGFLSNVPQRKGQSKTAVAINEDLTSLENVLDVIREESVPYHMLSIVIDHYKEIYKRREESNEEMQDREAAVFGDLDSLLMLSDSADYNTLHKWLDATTLREVDKEKSDGKLILSTVHSAKGLEWDHVILLDCVDGIFPKANDKDELDEELRCFYVAMTRAADTLDIFCPEKSMLYGHVEKTPMTSFLNGIDSDCYQTINNI